jgi:hypothetical protein
MMMKKILSAAMMLSMIAGTSALAASDEDRQEARQERKAERVEKREERREGKAEARKERPAALNIERARERVQEKREQVQEHREQVRERRDDLKDRRQELKDARAQGEDVREQRLRLQGRQDRVQEQAQRVRQQRERVQDQRERVQDRAQQQQRVEQQRRAEWLRQYRAGMYRLRDRDSGRSWYSYDRYRPTYYASQRYRLPTSYRYPTGWYVRTWGFGDVMPRSFYGQSYYLNWWQYGLPRPPIGSEWVRMRDDAILVDVWNGRVLAVYYDLFW